MADRQYLDICARILADGVDKGDRTGTGTRSIFGAQMRFDLNDGFPLLTTKRLPFRVIAEELFWFLRGETNVRSLQAKGVHIWDEWADEKGNLGPIYGKQWRSWPVTDTRGWVEIDQIAEVIEQIKTNPDSRRLIVSAWNVGEIDRMALPPCHMIFQFYVAEGKLSCQLYQRSADMFLGVPFNIASYALLTHLIADQCGLGVGEFVHTLGDAHIYANHVDQVQEQMTREPRKMPEIAIHRTPDRIEDYRFEDIDMVGYEPHPHIAGEVAI